MKLLHAILSLSLLLLVPSIVVESSSLANDNNVMSNITRGSSLSTFLNDSSYWLSPSGNIAFGLYQLPWSPDRYVVGIWFVKSPSKTLVWTANRNDLPLHEPSSILFTNDGKFMLRSTMPDNTEKPLIPDMQEPVLYAMMHDDGNFVLYGSDSQIIWQSFDYPTNTILSGQKLRPGVDLISGDMRLSVQQTDGLIAIHAKNYSDDQGEISADSVAVISDAFKGSKVSSRPLTLTLDSGGKLYLVGSEGVVLKYLHQNKKQHRKQQEEASIVMEKEVHIYRATLDSGGHFNLYKERIDGDISDDEKSTSILVHQWPHHRMSYDYIFMIVLGSIILVAILLLPVCIICTCIFDS